uniref:Uncharacterized protein n=1 Tax=Timema poppense TaxID=170557 RepID=A0A7R9DVQ3_TIMPO|nr:unnamed protein product [Timema poppensis]
MEDSNTINSLLSLQVYQRKEKNFSAVC